MDRWCLEVSSITVLHASHKATDDRCNVSFTDNELDRIDTAQKELSLTSAGIKNG